MRFKPILQGCTIVVAGDFTPTMFSPAWFRLQNLITDLEFEAANTEVIHDDLARFDIDESLGFEVQSGRFLIRTLEEPFVKIADLASMLFANQLVHTPVRGVGINYEIHFNTDSSTQREKLGRALAPLDAWGDWGREIGEKPGVEGGGVRSITMEESKPGQREGGYRRVRIEPSVRETVSPTNGVYVLVHDHFSWTEPNQTGNAAFAVLQENFDRSIAKAKSIVDGIMAKAASL